VLVALVVDRAARRAVQATRARAEGALLASFARTVLTRTDPLPRLLEKVREAFGLTAVALLEQVPPGSDRWTCVASSGPVGCLDPDEADVDVAVESDLHLIGMGRALPAADRRLLEVVGGQALLALRSQRAAAAADDSRRRAEATEIRSTLLSAVGHDLRSPLTSIKAAANSLADPHLQLPDADRRELAETVEESADRLSGLVDNLLDSSRLAAGAVEPLLAPVGYDEVVALALVGIEDRGRVTVEVDESLPDVVADTGLLERVVANVVDNALRYAGTAPVVLRASAYADRVELRIVDSGPGVPPRERDALFTPFQRLGRPHRGGTGAGRGPGFHGGHGRHPDGRGHPGRGPDRGRGAARGAAMTAHRVLVVDDDQQILRALRINLTAHGYQVLLAPDGGAALRAAADGHPDVVVLDLGLPDMDGVEVIEGLRGWTTVPIIVLSARVGSAHTVRALDAGADDYVTKPFGMAELLARLRAAVRRAAVATVDGEPVVDAGDFRVDLAAKRVNRADGSEVHLTPTEWGVLELLVRHRGKLVGQKELLRAVWGPNYGSETNYLRVYLAQLRRKLEPEPAHPRHLVTEAGMGYRFEV
jgi:two-component system sensor histidine kinase KdpD